MNCFGGIYRGRRVLLTGHTGFKGSWLALWLSELGATVAGMALDPSSQLNNWDLLRLEITDRRQDIRDFSEVREFVEAFEPEIVFHLAAQPLVLRSYQDPVETWSTNVMGTTNLLEACRLSSKVKAIVVVTTDKCYENLEWPWGYRESDTLGGRDPYSASKAATELVAASYRKAFFQRVSSSNRTGGDLLLATARAGNVVGGGDWSSDRLIPDIARAISRNEMLEVRSPSSTRPWQHVLESLSGYLLVGQRLLEGVVSAADAWNFGPGVEGNRSVTDVVTEFYSYFPYAQGKVTIPKQTHPHEATMLYLDSSKARQQLGWKTVWNFQKTIEMTAMWYDAFFKFHRGALSTVDMQKFSREQLSKYVADSQISNRV